MKSRRQIVKEFVGRVQVELLEKEKDINAWKTIWAISGLNTRSYGKT